MLEDGNSSCLTFEKASSIFGLFAIRIGASFRPNDFNRHSSTDSSVFHEMYFTHATTAQQADTMVVTVLEFF
jgi:hypothetical protein